MTIILEPARDPVEFNRVVAAQPISSPLQSWAFGEASKVLGHEAMRFYLRRGDSTVGALQLIRKRMGPGLRRLYAPRGPALESLDQIKDLAGPLRTLAKRTDAFVKIEPPKGVLAGTGKLPSEQDLVDDQRDIQEGYGAFRRSPTEQPEHTIIANLSRDQEDLFLGLHKMARRNVRTARKAGVQAAVDEDFNGFWKVFSSTNARANLGSYARIYYETLLSEGKKYGSDAYLVLARHQGRVLAGGYFLGLGETALYLYGGSFRDCRPVSNGGAGRRDVKASDAFYWAAMLSARDRGYRFLDFWGIPRVLDESKHSYGVAKMKLKYGSERYWFPAYDLPLSPIAIPVTRALQVRRKVLNYRLRGTTDDVF